MKKQLVAIGLASLLTLPSVALADATWYGSFRAIIHSQDGHTTMQSNGSRWGVKGSSEVSEGLSAVYLYEENLDLGTATIKDGNRLSYVGLSGGFGSVTMGQIWSATYNHPGVLTDNGVWSGNSGLTTARTNNTVSYAASTGPVSFQVDLQMDPDGAVKDKSVDMSQFGMTVDTGFARVALGAKSKATGEGGMDTGDKKLTSIAFSVPVGAFTFAVGAHSLKTKPNSGGSMKDERTQASVTGPVGDTGMTFGVNFADVNLHDDYTEALTTDAMDTDAQGRQAEDGSNPWNIHVAKALGGGASVAVEHIDHDHDKKSAGAAKSETVFQLRVDF